MLNSILELSKHIFFVALAFISVHKQAINRHEQESMDFQLITIPSSDFHGFFENERCWRAPSTPTTKNYAANEVSRPKSFPRIFFLQKMFFRNIFHIFRHLKISNFEILQILATRRCVRPYHVWIGASLKFQVLGLPKPGFGGVTSPWRSMGCKPIRPCRWSSCCGEIDLLNASGRPERRVDAPGHCHESPARSSIASRAVAEGTRRVPGRYNYTISPSNL